MPAKASKSRPQWRTGPLPAGPCVVVIRMHRHYMLAGVMREDKSVLHTLITTVDANNVKRPHTPDSQIQCWYEIPSLADAAHVTTPP